MTRFLILVAVAMLLLYQNCGQRPFYSQTSDLELTFGVSSKTQILTGTYMEYHVDQFDQDLAWTISAVESATIGSLQFNKDDLQLGRDLALRVGDEVQIVVESSPQLEQHFAQSKSSDTVRKQIRVRPIGLRKTYGRANSLFHSLGQDPSINDFRVAYVYMDFKDTPVQAFNFNILKDVAKNLSDSTWGKIQLVSTDSDFYRMTHTGSFPGCDQWYSLGSDAIFHVNNRLKKNYNRVVTILPNVGSDNCGWSGITSSGINFLNPYAGPIVARTDSGWVISHELGHSLGLGHSSRPNLGNYGDDYDIMGHGEKLNVSKLMDLGILKSSQGLLTQQPSGQVITLYGRSTNPLDQNVNIAYQLEDYLVSLTENYGLTIHNRTGKGAEGNEPSSWELARLKPGETWRSNDQRFQVQLLNWDLEQNKAQFKFNGSIEPGGTYTGGCRVFRASPNFSFVNAFSDASYGFFEMSVSNIGFVGNCENESLRFEITSLNPRFKIPLQWNQEINFGIKNYFSVLLPFYSLDQGTNQTLHYRVIHRGRLIEEKDINLSYYRCNANSTFCEFKMDCRLQPLASLQIPKRSASVGSRLDGNLILANPNAATCPMQEMNVQFSVAEETALPGSFAGSDLQLPPEIQTNRNESGAFPNLRLFLKPGEAIQIPMNLNINSRNSEAGLSIAVRARGPAFGSQNLYYTNATNAPSELYNLKTFFGDLSQHPFSPVSLSYYNVSGLIDDPNVRPPVCSVEVFSNASFRTLSSIQLKEGENIRLRINRTNTDRMEYRCGGEAWKTLALATNSEASITGLNTDVRCEFRAIRNYSLQNLMSYCTAGSPLDVDVLAKDLWECKKPNTNAIVNYTLEAKLRIDEGNLDRQGFYFLLGQTPQGDWYYHNGRGWAQGTGAFHLSPVALKNIDQFYVFKNDILTGFENSKVFVGYGLGTTAIEAQSEMNRSGRKFLCDQISAP